MKNKIIVGGFLYESLSEEEYNQYNSKYDHVLGNLGYKIGTYTSESGSGEEYSKRVGKSDIIFDDLSYNDEGDLSLSFGIRYGSHYVYSQRIFMGRDGFEGKLSTIDKALTSKANEYNVFIQKMQGDLRSSISGIGIDF